MVCLDASILLKLKNYYWKYLIKVSWNTIVKFINSTKKCSELTNSNKNKLNSEIINWIAKISSISI